MHSSFRPKAPCLRASVSGPALESITTIPHNQTTSACFVSVRSWLVGWMGMGEQIWTNIPASSAEFGHAEIFPSTASEAPSLCDATFGYASLPCVACLLVGCFMVSSFFALSLKSIPFAHSEDKSVSACPRSESCWVCARAQSRAQSSVTFSWMTSTSSLPDGHTRLGWSKR